MSVGIDVDVSLRASTVVGVDVNIDVNLRAVGYRGQALLATMEPKSDVRWLRSTSGYLTGAYWGLLVPVGAYGHLLEPEAI